MRNWVQIRPAASLVLAAAMLAACVPAPTAKVGTADAERRASAGASPRVARAVVLSATIRGPREDLIAAHGASVLANHGGSLLSNNAAGLVANNAAGVLANGGAMYALTGLDELTKPVAGATVTAYDVDGKAVGKPAVTDASGVVRLDGTAIGTGLLLRASYRVGEREVTLAAIVEPGADAAKPVAVDPATSLVAKRHERLRKQGSIAGEALTPATAAAVAQAFSDRLGPDAVVAAALLDEADASTAFDSIRRSDPELDKELARVTGAQPGFGADAPPPGTVPPSPVPSQDPGQLATAPPSAAASVAPSAVPTGASTAPASASPSASAPASVAPSTEATGSPATSPSPTTSPTASASTSPSPTSPAGGSYADAMTRAENFVSAGRLGDADDAYDDAIALCKTYAEALNVAASAKARSRTMATADALERATGLATTVPDLISVAERAADLGVTGEADDAYEKATLLCNTLDLALDIAASAGSRHRDGEEMDAFEKATMLVTTHLEGIRVGERAADAGHTGEADDAYDAALMRCTTAPQARAVESSARSRNRLGAADDAADLAESFGG